jgi:hypothetical protein
VHHLQVGRHPGAAVQRELDHRAILLTRLLAL